MQNFMIETWPILSIALSSFSSIYAINKARIYPRYILEDEFYPILDDAKQAVMLLLKILFVQIILLYFSSSHVSSTIAIINSFVSFYVLIYLANCWVVLIAIRCFDEPIKRGIKLLKNSNGIELILLHFFLNKYSLVRPFPEELEANRLFRMIWDKKTEIKNEKKLMDSTKFVRDILLQTALNEQTRKQYLQCDYAYTPSEYAELERPRTSSFQMTESAAFDGIDNLKLKALGLILVTFCVGQLMQYFS